MEETKQPKGIREKAKLVKLRKYVNSIPEDLNVNGIHLFMGTFGNEMVTNLTKHGQNIDLYPLKIA